MAGDAKGTTFEQAGGRAGAVTIGQKTLTVGPLSQAEEVELYDRLAEMARAEQGNHYEANRAMLDRMPAEDRAVALVRLVEMEAQRVPLSYAAVQRFRRSAKGAAHELFTRAKKYQPDLAEAEIAAVVTAANAAAVAEQVAKAVAGETPAGKP